MSGLPPDDPGPAAPGSRDEESLQRELDEALSGMNLESLMDLEEPCPEPAQAGGVRRGRVIAVDGEDIFVDMGGKSQGVLTRDQFQGVEPPAVGQYVEVTITGYDPADGLLLLSRQGAVQQATWASLEEGQIVEGRCTGWNKGGLELEIDGIKAFMPISQVSLQRIESEELASHVNRRMSCAVVEIRRAERSLIVSRREVLRRQEAEAAERTFASLEEGHVVKGTVRSIMPYGAFVDLGGVDGLLHVGDMSWSRVERPGDVVHEGQVLEVKILKIDRQTRKISLGLKQVAPDPWSRAVENWPPQTATAGRVTRLESYGAFVELEPGVEGLVPIGEMTFERRISHPRELVQIGDVVRVVVLNVDPVRRRIGLSIKQAGDDPWTGASVRWPADAVVEGTVSRIADFGAFVRLAAGVEGLVHISELSDTRVRRVDDVVREGQTVRVKVLNVDEQARRISLSIRQAVEAPPPEPQPQPSTGTEAGKKRKKPLRGGLDGGLFGGGLLGG